MDGARTFRELIARFLQLEQISRAVDMVCSTGTMPDWIEFRKSAKRETKEDWSQQ